MDAEIGGSDADPRMDIELPITSTPDLENDADMQNEGGDNSMEDNDDQYDP